MRVVLALTLLVGVSACSRPQAESNAAGRASADAPRAAQVVMTWRAAIDSLAWRTAQLDSAVAKLAEPEGVERARTAFVSARQAFKRAEVGLEYYVPSTARGMNGPALPEVEETEGPEAVFPPTGFQVVEEILFGDDPVADVERLTQETATLRQLVSRASTMMGAQEATDAHVWDAAKLEIARVVTLGITGFDSPVAGHSLRETDAALDGLMRSLAPYKSSSSEWTRLEALAGNARTVLAGAESRETFDHFAFVVDYANPLARALRETRLALGIGIPAERRAFRMDAATVFDTNAFDEMAFAPLDAPPMSEAQIALGQRLFHDTRLSGDGRRACSSCHLPEQAFTDGRRVNSARGGAPLSRNTPTVINAGLQVGVFSDLRTTYLEDQVTDVVENVDEMHGSLDATAVLLARDTALATQFRLAFAGHANRGGAGGKAVTAANIRSALAAYQRSLTRLDSPVDRALRGDVAALSTEAREGFNVFVGKGKCATCHFLPLTNGTVPPMYQKSEVEVLGTPSKAVTRAGTVDADEGRFRLSRAAPHRYAFRTPSLRNVALTAPYMHNGAYPTLESVIDFYNRGGGAGIGVVLENQTLPPDPLNLSTRAQRALLSFLRALTDTSNTGGR